VSEKARAERGLFSFSPHVQLGGQTSSRSLDVLLNVRDSSASGCASFILNHQNEKVPSLPHPEHISEANGRSPMHIQAQNRTHGDGVCSEFARKGCNCAMKPSRHLSDGEEMCHLKQHCQQDCQVWMRPIGSHVRSCVQIITRLPTGLTQSLAVLMSEFNVSSSRSERVIRASLLTFNL